jgi:DNA repair protein RecN (Recombination protein N)
MLRFLRIRDFALIRNLEIEFCEGLTVLTGETGSGKSIIVDAFGLLVGGRASQDMVRTNSETAVLEGVFTAENPAVNELMAAAGIEAEEESLLIRREISAGGRGRVFINNSLATLSLLKAIGNSLADIHGQQEHQALLDLSSHLKWLDRFGGNESVVFKLREKHREMRGISDRLDALAMDEQERQRLLDILRFQVEEIRRAEIRPGEKEELENERSILLNRERVFALANEAYVLLHESEHSIHGQLDRLTHIVRQLAEFDSTWAGHMDSLRDSLYRLEDLTYVARDYTGSIDFSPERLDQIERRLADLDRLKGKYGNSMEEVLSFADQCEARLSELISSSDVSARLRDELNAASKCYLALAEELSLKRRQDAARLEREIRREFQALALGKMDMSVHFHPRDAAAPGVPGRMPPHCGPEGVDQVEFLLAANPGEDLRPLAKIASGGELSRIMLSIKALCGGGETGKTMVFDEIDAGIGGGVAEVVGRRLRGISVHNQVLCVTHLPQIATHALCQFKVRKEVVRARTETFIERLDDVGRIQELARMMGGEVITDTTRRHAREMLENAGKGVKRESKN